MEAKEIIDYLRQQNFTVKADGEYLELSPSERITKEMIERLREHKPEIIAELKREERRRKVLTILAEQPEATRAIITALDNHPDNVIFTIAIRGQFSFEMTIPKTKYDPFAWLEFVNNGLVQ